MTVVAHQFTENVAPSRWWTFPRSTKLFGRRCHRDWRRIPGFTHHYPPGPGR